MRQQVAALCLVALALVCTVRAQYDPRKGPPILIRPGQTAKLVWKPAPPHPDVVMCCGGALQLRWSPMESGAPVSVVMNVDDSCPSELQNQQFVEYLYQTASRGIVTLDFKQNGDYYISSATAKHCADQGMAFLLAVRGCPTDHPTYTPVFPINVQCTPQQMPGLGAAGLNGTMGAGLGNGSLAGALPGALPGQRPVRTASGAGAASVSGLLAAAAGVLAAALL